MKGLELNENFYFDVVKKLIDEEFPMIRGRYSAGLIGYGSDVLGNDDEFSKDHEWGPRCHIWLNKNDYEIYSIQIDEMLKEKLPIEYMGYYTRYIYDNEYGALVTVPYKENSFHHIIGITTVQRHMKLQFALVEKEGKYSLSNIEWLCIPEQKLLELTRGKIFEDPIGEITKIRNNFKYYNDEIWKYKLIYCWNQISDIDLVALCLKGGDEIGAKICLNRIIENIVRITYLYNKTYYPGYIKWYGYEFSKLPKIANEIEQAIKDCQLSLDINIIFKKIEIILNVLLKEHNNLGITNTLNIKISKVARGLCNISIRHISGAIYEILTDEFKSLEVSGACDQWISNPDLLVWADKFSLLKSIYDKGKCFERNKIGDMII